MDHRFLCLVPTSCPTCQSKAQMVFCQIGGADAVTLYMYAYVTGTTQDSGGKGFVNCPVIIKHGSLENPR